MNESQLIENEIIINEELKSISPEPSLEWINKKIKEQICNDTIDKLKDENLLTEYKNCPSVKKNILFLSKILEKNEICTDKKQNILNDMLLELIPAGTKGVMRGNLFNKIVENEIKNMGLDKEKFEFEFEKKCDTCNTEEIPDWYIKDKITGKVIIGMNQLDLWKGGQQTNRGSKYLIDNKYNTENSKLLCVVCNDIQIKSLKNKNYKIFEIGFTNDTLCFLKNLKNIINSYFKL